MSSDCKKDKSDKLKELQDKHKSMFPSVADIDDVRVWKLTFHFADGNSLTFEDEEAFWGTGANARAVAQYTAEMFTRKGRTVTHWETDRDDNG